jgi:RNA polymerase sigma factor (sigma-70 family)
MATPALGTVLQHLRHSLRRDGDEVLTDGQLLERYLAGRDAAAFEALVCRHGPMVLGVCRRILRNEADAEDAFQAAFLVLVRKASSIRPRGMVSNWLYGVAHKTAMKAQAMIRKRRVKEQEAAKNAQLDTNKQPPVPNFDRLLDGELSRLPDKYRVPIILCGLEGKTIKEAARQLGWPQGTVGTRLTRGRSLLARRLSSYGLPLSAGLLTALLSQNTATASLSTALVLSTARAASIYAAGQAVGTGLVSTKVAALTEGVLKTMFLTKLKIAMVVVLTAGVVGAGLGLRAQPGGSQQVDPKGIGSEGKKPDEPPAKDKKAEDDPKTKPKRPERADIIQPAMMPLTHGKGAVTVVAFSPDGKMVATAGADKTIRLWELSTGKAIKKLTVTGEPTALTFTADGKRIVSGSGDGSVKAWNAENGELVWNTNALRGEKIAIAASPDGARVATGGNNVIFVIDTATGKIFLGMKTIQNVRGLAFSPDGKLLASAGKEGNIHLWDPPTGKQIQTLKGGDCNSIAFAPKGDAIAVAEDKGLRLFDIQNGKEKFHRDSKEVVRAVAYSPDGKTLASVGDDRVVRLWDAATGKEQRQFGDVQGKLASVAFSPNGRRLVTAGADGTAMVWDLTKEEKPLPKDLKLTEKDLIGLYADLASDDGIKSYAAARMLRADPARALPFLKERLKPREPAADETKIKKLIADLDADAFKTREAATKELQELGKKAEPALRQALANAPSAEVQTRAKKLLALLGENAPLTAEQQRDVRVIRVLEQTGTPEAKKLLEALLKESPGWWATQEAKEALERLSSKRDKGK